MSAIDSAAADIERRSQPSLHAQCLGPRRRAHDVYDRVDRAHFVKMHLLDRNGMYRRFRFAKRLKGVRGTLLHLIGKLRGANDAKNGRERPMMFVRMLMFVRVVVPV